MVDHVVTMAKAPLRFNCPASTAAATVSGEAAAANSGASGGAESSCGSGGGVGAPRSLRRPSNLIDAYCGGGLFCLAASAHFKRCAGVEVSALNVASAAENAARNGVANCAFFVGSAEDIFARVAPRHAAPAEAASVRAVAVAASGVPGEGFDPASTVVVIDPPRKGCSPEFLAQLLRFGPSRVVYVSCNPATQARDAAVLCGGGARMSGGVGAVYEVTDVTPFDLFPQTRHIESVMTLERREGPGSSAI